MLEGGEARGIRNRFDLNETTIWVNNHYRGVWAYSLRDRKKRTSKK